MRDGAIWQQRGCCNDRISRAAGQRPAQVFDLHLTLEAVRADIFIGHVNAQRAITGAGREEPGLEDVEGLIRGSGIDHLEREAGVFAAFDTSRPLRAEGKDLTDLVVEIEINFV